MEQHLIFRKCYARSCETLRIHSFESAIENIRTAFGASRMYNKERSNFEFHTEISKLRISRRNSEIRSFYRRRYRCNFPAVDFPFRSWN